MAYVDLSTKLEFKLEFKLQLVLHLKRLNFDPFRSVHRAANSVRVKVGKLKLALEFKLQLVLHRKRLNFDPCVVFTGTET